jgi:hypothetical protein
MRINVTKITDESLMQWACSMTIDSESNMSLADIYKTEHSPMRTQLFKVEMIGIPTFVSTHFVRHTQGVTHFCKTQRDDRGGSEEANRLTPTNHGMLINAQALINMARKRLCQKSHNETIDYMNMLRNAVFEVDSSLANYMVKECVYRGMVCHEQKPCGLMRSGLIDRR